MPRPRHRQNISSYKEKENGRFENPVHIIMQIARLKRSRWQKWIFRADSVLSGRGTSRTDGIFVPMRKNSHGHENGVDEGVKTSVSLRFK